MRRGVTLFASHTGVLAFQLVPRQPVIEFFLGRFPVDQVKLLAVVFQVAAHAIFAIRIVHLHVGVVTVLVGKSLGDFLVAIQTFVCGGAGSELVATVALRGTAERGVRLGEGTWGNLREGRKRGSQTARDREEDSEEKLPTDLTVIYNRCVTGRALVHQSLQV